MFARALFVPLRKAGACAAAIVALHGTAAANVLFSGSGTWYGDATFSSLSAPGATWSFLFVLPDRLPASTTSAISSFSYRLDGVAVAMPALSVAFYAAPDGGMFDIAFGNGAGSLSLYGDAVLTGGALSTGNYAVYAGVGGGQPGGEGRLALTLVPVPEPSTWATFALGLAAVAALARVRTRRAPVATGRVGQGLARQAA